MGEENPCEVCGGTDTKLVDGFYYCCECGTQDTTVRQTVVEQTVLADGTFAFLSKKIGLGRVRKKKNEGVQMSKEWHEWHAYNFIMAGVTDELIKLGAPPSIRLKILWIWSKYMNKHQNKDEMRQRQTIITEIKDTKESNTDAAKELNGTKPDTVYPEQYTVATILYLALNLEKSDIQQSALCRCLNNGFINLHKSYKYIPKDIRIKTMPLRNWTRIAPSRIARMKRTFQDLNLGPILVPNLENIIDNILQELCLPNSLKHLVLSLMDFAPIHFLDKENYAKKPQGLPDFEAITLSYVCVALKLCFGLDDRYEKRLSKVVDKINDEENHLKAYKSNLYCEPTDRLFSFREWSKYLLFRRHLLCKYSLQIAVERNIYPDDNVIEQAVEERTEKGKVLLSDEITMDIIKKIPGSDISVPIPKSEFGFSTTPLSTVTTVVLKHLRDPEVRRRLSEDFTQYSIDYAWRKLALPTSYEKKSKNIVKGVSERRKTYNECIGLNLRHAISDRTIVYVRNCENKNWFKTNPPKEEHVIEADESDDKDRDNGYDSNIENTPTRSNTNKNNETMQNTSNIVSNMLDNEDEVGETKLQVFEEEDAAKNIFDDDFLDMEEITATNNIQGLQTDINESKDTINLDNTKAEYNNNIDFDSLSYDSDAETHEEPEPEFDPATFNRKETIKAIILACCEKYKLPVPYKYKKHRKRKLKNPTAETAVSKPKKRKCNEERELERVELNNRTQEIIAAYQSNLEHDVMHQVALQVASCIGNRDQEIENNITDQDQAIADDNNTAIEVHDDSIKNTNEPSEVDHENNLAQSQNESDELDDEPVYDPVYKGAPKFDEKTYDTKQLYVKVKGGFENNDVFQIDSDEELNEVLKNEIVNTDKNQIPKRNIYTYDSEDDLPLSKFKQDKEPKTKAEEGTHNSLIDDPEKLSRFNYWFRHYISDNIKKFEWSAVFDADLINEFPKSFAFIMIECAAVFNVVEIMLYRYITDIEQKMLKQDGFTLKRRKPRSYKDRVANRDCYRYSDYRF